ncbi:MAG: 3-dehydroquinate synthase [Phycisphaerales bacterium]|nr:3-dehydroquinate synthase [Phycisphaerales bacterium]
MSDRHRVRIDLHVASAPRECAIHVGSGLLEEAGEILSPHVRGRRLAIICDAAVAQTHGQTLARACSRSGFDCHQIAVPSGEAHKTVESAARLYEAMLAASLDRSSALIALGGGVTTDLAGFAAATFMRGITLINAPTTLLGMVDASIGGKTGVNFPLPGSAVLGKNLVGAFHHPAAVLMDAATLHTLPPRAFRCGLAECLKHALIADPSMLDWIEAHSAALQPARSGELIDFIARNARIKADVVAGDERETGQRLLLNLGHTFAHAIETRPELGLEHGEAVALGLLAACAAGEHLKITDLELRPRLRAVIGQLGLPVRLTSSPPLAEVLSAMNADKKTEDGKLRLLIPVDVGVVEMVRSAPDSAVEAGLASISP